MNATFDVGGVSLERPFKVRRLNHIGLDVRDLTEHVRFFTELLGWRISDELTVDGIDLRGWFLRYGSDHHSLVLLDRDKVDALLGTDDASRDGVDLNQLTWQVNSLSEVVAAASWLPDRIGSIQRAGRDMPGSNWHVYFPDPDGFVNELLYGIEQIGWSGYSKPSDAHKGAFESAPPLPQPPEYKEISDLIAAGVDLTSGHRGGGESPPRFEVDGILLPQPFKVTRLGPVHLFVEDLDEATTFYASTMGFSVTERTKVSGHECVFLRVGPEHHSLGLFDRRLSSELGADSSRLFAYGMQVANYRQLRSAVAFLREAGVEVHDDLPASLYPGIDVAAHAVDPSGHRVLLYFDMDQVGWSGQPKPAKHRTRPGSWPDVLEGDSDTFDGEPFMGPWH